MSDVREHPSYRATEHEHALALAIIRWGNDDGIPVHHCGHPLRQSNARPRCFSCYPCNERRSVTAGTLLAHCKVQLWKVFAMAEALAQPDRPSSLHLSRVLGVHVETAWNLRHRLMASVASVEVEVRGEPTINEGVVALQPPVPHHTPLPDEPPPSLEERHHRQEGGAVSVLRGDRGEGPPVAIAIPQMRRTLQRLTNAEPVTREGPPMGKAAQILQDLATHTAVVFFGVSGRWLQRYAQFAAKRTWALGPQPARGILALTLGIPPMPFDALRPGATPALDDRAGIRLVDLPCAGKAWARVPHPTAVCLV
jgi:hypothetical protein